MIAQILQDRDSYLAELDSAFQDFINMTQKIDEQIMDILFEQQCEEYDNLQIDKYN